MSLAELPLRHLAGNCAHSCTGQLRKWDIIEASDLKCMFMNIDEVLASSKKAVALSQQDMDRCGAALPRRAHCCTARKPSMAAAGLGAHVCFGPTAQSSHHTHTRARARRPVCV